MARLDDPAARPPVGMVSFAFNLFAAAADVGLEALADGELADVVVVVSLVEAEPLRLLLGGDRPRQRDRLKRLPEELLVVAVSAVLRDPNRDPGSLGQERALRPPLALSVGLGPVAGPPSGAFVIAPSAASQDQSIPISSS